MTNPLLALAQEVYESMKLCLEKDQNNNVLLQVKLKQSAAFDEELKKLEEEVQGRRTVIPSGAVG